MTDVRNNSTKLREGDGNAIVRCSECLYHTESEDAGLTEFGKEIIKHCKQFGRDIPAYGFCYLGISEIDYNNMIANSLEEVLMKSEVQNESYV